MCLKRTKLKPRSPSPAKIVKFKEMDPFNIYDYMNEKKIQFGAFFLSPGALIFKLLWGFNEIIKK